MTDPFALTPVFEPDVDHAVEFAALVPGWMGDYDLRLLASWARGCRRVVEVGCWQGRSTTALALALPEGGRLFAVDHWRGETDRPDLTGPALRCCFERNCQSLIETGRVHPIGLHSLDAAVVVGAGDPLDLVFVDAAHDYASVRDDIAAWLPLVRPGGAIAGHDHWQEGVRRALDERFGGGQWTEASNHLWLWKVPG